MSAYMYVCKRDCVIIAFKLAISENIYVAIWDIIIHLDNNYC